LRQKTLETKEPHWDDELEGGPSPTALTTAAGRAFDRSRPPLPPAKEFSKVCPMFLKGFE
jgi:hypothetical protein